ncbi:MAG TPA: hypothetical protein DEP48_03015 [Persephonella sp.]|uniref:Uncharacterized protein n=1 Tax=Persephonella marina (strain DSM 14350 / EX-H1) TaxID=123214 RepID=C0QSB6_PERMH|nr:MULTISPECIES: hypothetical protein [Persephonella]ACO04560.1 hypothetical protein PERMA_1799 [Persephonella marina EX-H1]HCB69309.1 hypothetical protein [Persephonella sp.]
MDIREIKDSQVIISNKPPIVKALNQPSESDIKAFTEYINGKLQDLKEEVSNFIKEFHATLWITSFIFTYITLAYMHKWMKYPTLESELFFFVFFFFGYMGSLYYFVSIIKLKNKRRIRNKAKEWIEEIKNTKPIFNAYCSKNKEYLYQLDLIKEEFEKIKNWKWDKLAP